MDERPEQLGLATDLICSAPTSAQYDLRYIRLRVQPAIMHDQICFGFDERGRALAFWIWGFLAPDVEKRLLSNPRATLHESEWNEGGSLWILDIVAPYGHVRDVVYFVRRHFFDGYERAFSARAKRSGRIKVSEWRRPVAAAHGSAPVQRFRLPFDAFYSSKSEWRRQHQEMDCAP